MEIEGSSSSSSSEDDSDSYGSSESSSGDSDYTSDSEEEARSRLLLKPTFIPKSRRVTVAERERMEAEEAAVLEEEKKRLQERQAESRQMVLDEIQRDLEKPTFGAVDGDIAAIAAMDRDVAYAGGTLRGRDGAEIILSSSSSEDSEDELELERWKLRELQRLRRDRDERLNAERQQAEVERRRKMTDAEIELENERLGLKRQAEEEEARSGKMQFLQRYYHKGVFFMDENQDDELFQRDFNAPTGEDKEVDKAALPEVMQVKNFGKRGRTKYTHLVDQDTSDLRNNPWASRIARQTSAKFRRFRGSGAIVGGRR